MTGRSYRDYIMSLNGQAAVMLKPQPTVHRVFVDCPRCGRRAAKYPAEARISCGVCGNLRILNR